MTLLGGSLGDPNRLVGGTIDGAGFFSTAPNHALVGFGTISAAVTFNAGSQLLADGGTLSIVGSIANAGTIGTASATGVLHVLNAWDTNMADHVVLAGGTLQGGTMTIGNAAGVEGHGLIASRLVNNTQLDANVASQSLVVETAANDNDWDGTGNTGTLAANGGLLELRDNLPFSFTGSVVATAGGTVFTNGFAMNFDPGSSLSLSNGRYQSTNSVDFGGNMIVNAGPDSTIQVKVNRFLTIEATSSSTLNGNLRLESNNANIEAGAAFSGTGSVVVPAGSHLIPKADSNINVLLDNQGTIRLSGFDAVGRVDVRDYQQSGSGRLIAELEGTNVNQFDRLVVSGAAFLSGILDLDIDGGFVPQIGNTFNIVTASAGVSGTFGQVEFSGMPTGLGFHVNYLPTSVQLQVVNLALSCDLNGDGSVDAADAGLLFAVWGDLQGVSNPADKNADGLIDAADAGVLFSQWTGDSRADAQTSQVPEPLDLGVVVLALCGGFAISRNEWFSAVRIAQ